MRLAVIRLDETVRSGIGRVAWPQPVITADEAGIDDEVMFDDGHGR